MMLVGRNSVSHWCALPKCCPERCRRDLRSMGCGQNTGLSPRTDSVEVLAACRLTNAIFHARATVSSPQRRCVAARTGPWSAHTRTVLTLGEHRVRGFARSR